MSFIRTDDLPRLELFPKALSGIVQGENLMLSFLELAPGCRIPEHSHPHEQAGFVLSGRLRFRIGEEERITGPGDAFLVPPNVVHEGRGDRGRDMPGTRHLQPGAGGLPGALQPIHGDLRGDPLALKRPRRPACATPAECGGLSPGDRRKEIP